jgi:hypothetical protein
MPTRVVADDDEQIIADLQEDVRRLRGRLATTAPRGGHDGWTAAATPATTYQLSTIPVSGTCEFVINGHEQREGTDYIVDYSTGVVTVSASLASGDKLVARYLVTDWLVARTLPEDTGNLLTEQEAYFETGGPLWTAQPDGTPTISRVTPGSTGTYAAKCLATTTDNLAHGLQAYVTRFIPVTLGVTYTIRVTFKSLAAQSSFNLAMQGWSSTPTFKETHSISSGGTISSTTFNTFSGTVTFTNAATTQGRLQVISGSGPIAANDFFIVDDVFWGDPT